MGTSRVVPAQVQQTHGIPLLTEADSPEFVQLVSRGRAHFLAGDLVGARAGLERGLVFRGPSHSLWRVRVLGSLALLEAWEGQTIRAAERAREALAVAGLTGALSHVATADAFLANALVAVIAGDLQLGDLELRHADIRLTSDRSTSLAWVAYAIGGELRTHRGDEHPVPLPWGSPPPIAVEALAALRARSQRLRGNPAAAQVLLANQSSESSAVLFERGLAYLAAGRLSDTREAQRLLANPPDSQSPLRTTRSLLLETSLSATHGRTPRTDALFLQALWIADKYDLVSVFIDAGPEITSRLMALGLPSLPPVATRVIRGASALAQASDGTGLAEPLTERERELLVLLPTGFTNTQLAERYFVSVNTIKSHMAHIYRKLDVSTRSSAIERATLLGVIAPWSEAWPPTPNAPRATRPHEAHRREV